MTLSVADFHVQGQCLFACFLSLLPLILFQKDPCCACKELSFTVNILQLFADLSAPSEHLLKEERSWCQLSIRGWTHMGSDGLCPVSIGYYLLSPVVQGTSVRGSQLLFAGFGSKLLAPPLNDRPHQSGQRMGAENEQEAS